MLVQQRHTAILSFVRERGGASVTDLARRLDVSESTIRRDLNALDREGLLQRVRGGGAVEVDDQPFAHVAKFVTIGRTPKVSSNTIIR